MKSPRLRILVLASLALAAACRRQPPEPRVAPTTAADAAAQSLPVADLPLLQRIIHQADAADQVLVVDFWATWCPPCIAMFPTLHDNLTAMGPAVRSVSVTFDAPGEAESHAIAFLKAQHAMRDAYILSDRPGDRAKVVDTLGHQWNMLVVPAILVFNQDGQLAGEFLGPQPAPVLQRVRTLTAG